MAAPIQKSLLWSAFIAVSLVFGFAGSHAPYKTTKRWVCAVSGSTRIQVTWLGCFKHEERTVTALEKWLVRNEANFEPNWQFLSKQTQGLFSIACGKGRTPEVYRAGAALDGAVEKMSDGQIAHLVSVLRRGSSDEQRQLLQKVTADVF